jgi:hypothetical protein
LATGIFQSFPVESEDDKRIKGIDTGYLEMADREKKKSGTARN